MNYDPKKIESKWQKFWEKNKTFQTPKDATPENKFYILPQLPYPSGSGLHVGHAEVYTACDIYARYQRMKGKKVLQVIGWDSFGLPAENYAIKTNIHPKKSTEDAIDNFRSQIKSLGISVDWEREVGSHNPDYYKWTQWFFLLMYKRGLAYRKKQAVNWCDSCKTVLANEQVVTKGTSNQGPVTRIVNVCERCETEIVQREMEQWYLKITEYADRLLEGLDRIDWPEETKKRQKDWIGRSEGAEITFAVRGTRYAITVFTTRPDTLFGATYLVLAPEHPVVRSLKTEVKNWDEVEAYIEATKKKTELDRQTEKEKTGVELKGIKAINPANGEEIPVWIADYVLATYGTGAIMAVPAHDERDWEFAKKFGLAVQHVVAEKSNTAHPDAISRECIFGVIRNKEGKILVLRYKPKEWYRLPGGGYQDGETDIEALTREIAEETGYSDFEITEFLGYVQANYFNFVNKNHRTEFKKAHSVTLLSDKQTNPRQEDLDNFDILWVSYNEALQLFAKNSESWGEEQFLQRIHSNPCFTGEGINVNSNFLNGLGTPEAKEKIIAWLEEHNHGKRKTQYKLRDWSVSRQRFWGAPIPMLHNEERAKSKKQYIIIHGYGGTAEDNFFPWLKKELETQGHDVWCETLPNTDAPKADDQADFILKHAALSKDTVIVAHSHGGAVAFRMLEKMNQKIAKLVLVDTFTKPVFNDNERGPVDESTVWSFDLEKIKSLADEIVLLGDNRYPIIPKEEHEFMWRALDARLVLTHPNDDHFCSAAEPVILEESIVTGLLPLSIDDLPVLLPNDVDFKPTGQSPLVYSEDFQKGVEKKYGKGPAFVKATAGKWKREPDTLDTFMCSSWYYYRYLDPKNDDAFASPESLKAWMPVDFYLGGAEHVNGHLLYSRFFTKVLYDAGYIDFDEPFAVHRHQGLILGEDSKKMSKRWGNVINPTDVVNEFGADTCRMYEMFMGPLEETKPWNTNGVRGIRRFLEKVWKLKERVTSNEGRSRDFEKLVHQTLKKVSEDLDTLSFNTAIAKLMELVNAFQKEDAISKQHFELFILMLAPFAPHMAEELWNELGHKKSIACEPWPAYDPEKIVEDVITLVVQVNGKVRASLEVASDISEEEAKAQALAHEQIQKWLDDKEPKRIIYIQGKLVNIVI